MVIESGDCLANSLKGLMKHRLTILFVIGLLVTLFSWITDKSHAWGSSAFLNFGSGIITSVLLIYLYDESRAKAYQAEKSDRERRVVRGLKTVMRQHYRMLLDCYRSATTESNPPNCASVNEFIGIRFHETVKHLDIYAPSPMSSYGETPYYAYIEQSFKRFQNLLQQALNHHAIDLRLEFASAIEDLLDSSMLAMSVNLATICTLTPPGFPPHMVQFNGMERNIQDYGIKYCRLLNAMENVEPQGLKEYKVEDWHNACFPMGHARSNL